VIPSRLTPPTNHKKFICQKTRSAPRPDYRDRLNERVSPPGSMSRTAKSFSKCSFATRRKTNWASIRTSSVDHHSLVLASDRRRAAHGPGFRLRAESRLLGTERLLRWTFQPHS
jgi:hypothetical protein